jgi:hypothetical protein
MNDANNDPIGKALNMAPMEIDNIVNSMTAESHDDSANKDFEFARANLYGVIENGQEALFKLAQIADASQHPRAFEVLSTLMKTIVDANKDLLDLQKKIRDIKDADDPQNEKAKTINNNLFVGSTAELQKMITDLKKNDNT